MTVELPPATLTFETVTQEGFTSVDARDGAPALPDGYLEAGATYYDIHTTALFSGDGDDLHLLLRRCRPRAAAPPRRRRLAGRHAQQHRLAGLRPGRQLLGLRRRDRNRLRGARDDHRVRPAGDDRQLDRDLPVRLERPTGNLECSLDAGVSWGSCEGLHIMEDLPRSSRRYPTIDLPTEALRRNNRPALTWSIADSGTHRGYRLVPGNEAALPADTFAVGDVWLLKYKSNETDDAGQSGPACASGSTTSSTERACRRTRVLVPHRAYHEGGDLDDCHPVGRCSCRSAPGPRGTED